MSATNNKILKTKLIEVMVININGLTYLEGYRNIEIITKEKVIVRKEGISMNKGYIQVDTPRGKKRISAGGSLMHQLTKVARIAKYLGYIRFRISIK